MCVKEDYIIWFVLLFLFFVECFKKYYDKFWIGKLKVYWWRFIVRW